MTDYPTLVLQELYAEGDIDLIFLDQLIGLLTYDEKDNLRQLSPNELISNAMTLIAFLSSDFDVARLGVEGKIERHVQNIEELSPLVSALIQNPTSETQFCVAFLKKTRGVLVGDVPPQVMKIFQ